MWVVRFQEEKWFFVSIPWQFFLFGLSFWGSGNSSRRSNGIFFNLLFFQLWLVVGLFGSLLDFILRVYGANFFKNGAMNLKVGILAAIGSFAGSALGAHIVLLLSDEMLRTMMFIILPVAAVIILWQRNLPDENRDDGTLNARKAVLALAIGLGIGLYDGIFGPGTGTFAIIAFTTLMGFDLRTAGGNAKVLNLASNYASLVTYLSSGLVVFSIGIPCAVSGIVGNLLGSHFALKNGAKFIRPMMLVVLVLLLGKIVSDAVL